MVDKTIWDQVIAWLPVVGVAGFLLSLFNTWQNLGKDKRRLRLNAYREFVNSRDERDDLNLLIIRTSNTGHRNFTIHKARIFSRGNELYSLPWDQDTIDAVGGFNVLPKGLSQGEFCDISFVAADIAHNIKGDPSHVSLHVKVELATGESFALRDILFKPKQEEFPELTVI